MLFAFIIFVILLSLLFSTVQYKKYKTTLLPKGPRGLPFVGNLLQLARSKPHLKLSQWALQYGKLYTIKLGPKPVLVITDVKLMRELLRQDATASSPLSDITGTELDTRWGVHAEGNEAAEQRQFLNRVIRKFGFGEVSCTEALIKHELRQLMVWFKSEQANGGKVRLNEKLTEASANVVWGMCSGKRFQADLELNITDIKVQYLKHLHKVIMSGLLFCPWIKYLAPEASGYSQYIAYVDILYKYVEKLLRQRVLTRVKDEEPQNIIDAYLEKLESCQDRESSFYGDSGWKHCVNVILTLFVSGGDGPGMMATWIIFYLSVYPNIQQKVQKEIEKAIGCDREPNLEDKQNMPYTEAVILEALRFASTMATGVTQMLTEDITFQGYQLPKGMFIQPLLYHVHFDKAIWGDPENFRPERFLGDGTKLKEFLVAFQMGKKVCPGQQISHAFLFLSVAMLLQKYTFQVDPSEIDSVEEYLEPVVTLVLEPKPLSVLAIER